MHIRLNVSLVKKVVGKRSNASSFTSSIVLFLVSLSLALSVVPIENCRVTGDLESLGKLLLDCSVNLAEFNFALEFACGLVPFGLKSFAMPAPGRVKLN